MNQDIRQFFDYSEIKNCCDEMYQVANKMGEILGEIETSISTLKSSGLWQGKGANYYINKAQNLVSNFESVHQKAVDAALYLSQEIEHYESTENSITGIMQSKFNLKGSSTWRLKM